MKGNISNIVLFVGLNITDAFTTDIILSLGGREANPIATFWFIIFPQLNVFAIKAIFITLTLMILILLKPLLLKRFGLNPLSLLPFLNIIFLGIVLWSVILIGTWIYFAV